MHYLVLNKKPEEMRSVIIRLKLENEELKKTGGIVSSNGDRDALVSNLLEQAREHEKEKERLQNALKTLKENSILGDIEPAEKQTWVLRQENARLKEELQAAEERYASINRELLIKSERINFL